MGPEPEKKEITPDTNLVYLEPIYPDPDQVIEDFTSAIDFAIEDDEPALFLRCWREGDWDTLRKEWPEFKLPPMAEVGGV